MRPGAGEYQVLGPSFRLSLARVLLPYSSRLEVQLQLVSRIARIPRPPVHVARQALTSILEWFDAEGRTLPRLSSKADKAFLSAGGHGPIYPANSS